LYKKQYDIDHKIQRLYVHWDVSTQCNFKCTYCYAMKEYGEKWGRIDRWEKQKLIIGNIRRSTLPVFLGLLGGEPTLHPHYEELVEGCYNAVRKQDDGRLYITTNGSKEIEFFKSHKYYKYLYFLWSFHPEYEGIYGKGFKTILNNIRLMADRGFKSKVNVMLHHDKRFWKKTHKFVDEIEKIDGLEIHPHFLYADGDVHKLEEYNDNFYKEFVRFKDYPGYFTFEDEDENQKLFNDYNIFKSDLTHFKGWDCWNNNYEISYDGIVHRVCFPESSHLVTDFNYFKNIKRVCPVTCPHTSCNCDGLLKIHKVNNT
jgi:MoaA/NifB/PqqE/SkfB family radical SAM enzyme